MLPPNHYITTILISIARLDASRPVHPSPAAAAEEAKAEARTGVKPLYHLSTPPHCKWSCHFFSRGEEEEEEEEEREEIHLRVCRFMRLVSGLMRVERGASPILMRWVMRAKKGRIF